MSNNVTCDLYNCENKDRQYLPKHAMNDENMVNTISNVNM